ncbi:hypothetical protein [Polaribacter sp.]|uniref:hypothetical protein n=1 Tax=Polaribacter sp. TaxID=1920175 RepID=UPI003F69A17C
MKAKWYISTLFLIFTLFGAFHEQGSIPNQEIVLEFVNTKNNSNYINHTIADVKEKLLNIGVSHINIKEVKNGTLKISYFSEVPVDNIRNILIKNNSFLLKNSSKNQQNKDVVYHYSLDVYDLNKPTDNANLDYKYALEIKHQLDRFTTDNYFDNYNASLENKTNQLYKVAYKIAKNNPFSKEYRSNKEPEVRAGPKNFQS